MGVPQNADARQLREAYQTLLLQHEGDAQCMREISMAYEAILLSRGGGKSGEALALLEGVPEEQRDSEWHYRMGCLQRGRGWLEEAEARFRHAALFEPENLKYRAALKCMERKRADKSDSDECTLCDGAGEGCCECFCSFI